MVSVGKETDDGDNYIVLSPCGNCRQLIFDYAPNCTVILSNEGKAVKARSENLLLCPFKSQFGVSDQFNLTIADRKDNKRVWLTF